MLKVRIVFCLLITMFVVSVVGFAEEPESTKIFAGPADKLVESEESNVTTDLAKKTFGKMVEVARLNLIASYRVTSFLIANMQYLTDPAKKEESEQLLDAIRTSNRQQKTTLEFARDNNIDSSLSENIDRDLMVAEALLDCSEQFFNAVHDAEAKSEELIKVGISQFEQAGEMLFAQPQK